LIPVLRFYSSGQICGDETDSLNNVVITSYVNFFPVVFLLFGGIIAVQCLDLIGTSDKKKFFNENTIQREFLQERKESQLIEV